MKKTSKLLTVGCSVVLAAGMLLGTGCDSSAWNDGGKGTAFSAGSSLDVYAASAVSGAAYFNALNQNNRGDATTYSLTENYAAPELLSETTSDSATTSESEKPVSHEDLNGIIDAERCISIFENVVNGEITQTVEANREEGKYGEYEYVMRVDNGSVNLAAIYYNEVSSKTETESAEEDDDADEVKITSFIKGVVVYGENEYVISGVKEVETEGSEEEFSIEFKTGTDELNYVEFNYEIEKEEDEKEVTFEYKVIENGFTVLEAELETETEKGEGETEFSVKRIVDGVAEKFKIEENSSRKNVFYITREVDKVKTRITVEKTEDGYKIIDSDGENKSK